MTCWELAWQGGLVRITPAFTLPLTWALSEVPLLPQEGSQISSFNGKELQVELPWRKVEKGSPRPLRVLFWEGKTNVSSLHGLSGNREGGKGPESTLGQVGKRKLLEGGWEICSERGPWPAWSWGKTGATLREGFCWCSQQPQVPEGTKWQDYAMEGPDQPEASGICGLERLQASRVLAQTWREGGGQGAPHDVPYELNCVPQKDTFTF